MVYDLKLLSEMCSDFGLDNVNVSSDSVEINLFDDVTLVFKNFQNENDSLIGFLGTPWHAHGNIMFSRKDGHYIDLNYLDIIEGLRKGTVLICEQTINGELKDRYLIHRDYFDELRFIELGEEIRIRRIV